MGKTLVAAFADFQWSVSTASTSWFLGLGGGFGLDHISTGNEARFQLKMPAAGTLRNLSAYVLTNSRTTNTTIKTRINGVTGNQVVTYGSTVTGRQTDSTHTDAIAAGDLVNYIVTTGTGSGSFASVTLQIEWETTTGCTTVFTYNFDPAVSLSAARVDVFPVDGMERNTIWGSPVDDYRKSRCYFGCAGTLSNLRAYVVTQSMNINPTVEIYKNGSATGVTLSLTGTGAFEDTTHTVAVSVGDYIQFKTTTTGRTSGSLALANVQMQFTSSDSKTPMFTSLRQDLDPTSVGYNTGTIYGGLTSNRFVSTTESQHDMLASFAVNISHLQAGWLNNSGGNETLTLRKNAADTASVLTFAALIASTTNTVDTTNTISYSANDTFSTKAVTLSSTSGAYLMSIVLDSATSTAYTLTSAEGTYALTGQAVTWGRSISAVKGQYNINGKAAVLGHGLVLSAVEGTYVLTGKTVTWKRSMSAVQGAYALTGHATSTGRLLLANQGAYHVIGYTSTYPHQRLLAAHVGRYHVRRKRIILRLNGTQTYIFPTDDGLYELTGQDAVFGQDRLRLSFSEFINTSYLDWSSLGGSDYLSYLNTAYVIPSDVMTWTQVPYIYVFVDDTDSPTDVGLLMNVVRNWAMNGDVPQNSGNIQVYRHREGYILSTTKTRVRGRGRVYQVQFRSETGKAFNVRGWAAWIEKNSGV